MIQQKDFTYDHVNFKGLPEFVHSIKKDGLRYIIILVSVIMKRVLFIPNISTIRTVVLFLLCFRLSVMLQWFLVRLTPENNE